MYNQLLFLAYWLTNYLVFYVFYLLFPDMIVLGNHRLVPIEAAIFSGFWVTFFIWCLWDYMYVRKVEFETDSFRFIFSFLINSLGVWLVTRYSQYTGVGIVNFGWAFVLGAVASLFQKFIFEKIEDSGK